MSIAQTTDNVTVEDVARVLVADGVTIPQARDAHEWGLNTLNLWSQVADANRRTEAMQALMAVRQLSSQEDWDRLVPLEPPIPWKLRRGEHISQSYSGKERAYHECDCYTNGATNDACSDFASSPEGSGSR